MGITESFLLYNKLPNDENALVDLKKTAVAVMCHLDRLALPYSPSPISYKVGL